MDCPECIIFISTVRKLSLPRGFVGSRMLLLPRWWWLSRKPPGGDRLEEVVDLTNSRMNGYFGYWFGLAPDDSPLLLRDTRSQEIYALDWQTP